MTRRLADLPDMGKYRSSQIQICRLGVDADGLIISACWIGGGQIYLMPRDDATTRRAFEIDVTKRKRKSERDRDRESKRLKTDRRMLSIEPQENSNTKFLFESSIKASNHQASVKRFNNTHYHSSSFR